MIDTGYTKEQVMKALENAPLIGEEDMKSMRSCNPDKVAELQKNGLPHLKGLWVLTKYRHDEFPNLIADMDVEGYGETELDAAIWKLIPHDCCYKLTCEVLGEEDNMFIGTEKLLQTEIMNGNICKIYPCSKSIERGVEA